MSGIRVWLVGTCDGFTPICDFVAWHPELESTAVEPEVVLFATSGTTLPLDEIEALRQRTTAPIVLLAPAGSAPVARDVLAAGVADMLLLPQPSETVLFAIQKATFATRENLAEPRDGLVMTVFSPKGGTGKSVTSSNLAASLAAETGRRTLLLDLDLQFGDAAIMLGLEPRKTLLDLVTAPGDLDADKLAGYVTPHPTGVDLLPAPLRPEDADAVSDEKITQLLAVARGTYDAVVVDTSPHFHGSMLAALDASDLLLLLCAPDVATLKNVRLTLQTLELLSFPAERIRIVLNHASRCVGLKRGEVGAVLGRRIDFDLPGDQLVPIGINKGEPAVLADRTAPYASALLEMLAELAPGSVALPTAEPRARAPRFAFARS